MKKIILVISLVFPLFQINAQTVNTILTLDQAIEKAMENRYEVKIQKNTIKLNENEEKKAKAKYLPLITGDLDLRWNTRLQTNVIPPGFVGPTEKRIQFGTKYNTLIPFNLTQPLFNLQTAQDVKITKAQTEYQKLNQKVVDVQVKQDVTEAYLSALLSKEKARISEINFNRTNDISSMAQSQLKEGAITSYDYQRTRLDYENARAEHQKNKKSYILAMRQLSYKIVGDTSLSSYQLEDFQVLYQKNNSDNIMSRDINRNELLMEKAQQQIYDLNVRKQRLAMFPTINFYANYTFNQLTSTFNPGNTTYYFPYNYLGVKASLTIYNGGARHKAEKEYMIRSEGSRLNYMKLKNDYSQEMENASTSLNNAKEDLDYQKKNLELADELYKIDSSRFNSGTIRQTDLNTTYYTFQQTQNNYINALYNYLLAIIKYKKAAGTL
jgi:outer membrane protein